MSGPRLRSAPPATRNPRPSGSVNGLSFLPHPIDPQNTGRSISSGQSRSPSSYDLYRAESDKVSGRSPFQHVSDYAQWLGGQPERRVAVGDQHDGVADDALTQRSTPSRT